MKVLFIVPSFSLIGGVANHYLGLNDYWSMNFKYSVQGHRHGIHAALWLFPDYIKFLFQLLFYHPEIVVVNPSLGRYMLIRDAVYLLLSKLFGCKVVCFFHGWNIPFSKTIEKNPSLFNGVYGKADLTYVLSNEYKLQLQKIGFPGNVQLNTTKVDDKLLKGFDISERRRPVRNILYLARVARAKGIFIAIDAFMKLSLQFPEIRFTIVGNGVDLEEAKQYVNKKNINNIQFTGGLTGEKLMEQYRLGDLYILPTYFEGMATSVLEAMAFGLPVLTAPVGGVVDFFENGEMGFLIQEYDAEKYVIAMIDLIKNKSLYDKIVQINYNYAKKNFLASIVAKRMEKDFKAL